MMGTAPQIPMHSSAATPSILSHVDLMRACKEQDSEAVWQEFVARYNRFVCLAVLRAYCQNRGQRPSSVDNDLIDDLVQEVYVKLFESARGAVQEFRGATDAAVFVYIGRVALSVVIDYLRRSGARKRWSETCSLDAIVYSDDDQETTMGERLAAPGPTPEQEAVGEVLRTQVAAILNRILRGRNAERDLRIAEAFIFDGASLAEIAGAIGGIRESGIKSSIRRTSLRLRSELTRLERLATSRRS